MPGAASALLSEIIILLLQRGGILFLIFCDTNAGGIHGRGGRGRGGGVHHGLGVPRWFRLRLQRGGRGRGGCWQIAQQRDHLRLLVDPRHILGGLSLCIGGVDHGAVLQQQLHHLHEATACGHHQRRVSVGGRGVDLGAVLQQQLDHIQVVVLRGQEQRGGAARTGGFDIRIQFSQEERDRFELPVEGGEV